MSSATESKMPFEGLVPEVRPAPPCAFVLFGATGDLAAKKIAPALYNLAREGLVTDRTFVLGAARRQRSDEQFRHEMHEAIARHSRTQPVDEAVWEKFAPRWYYTSTHGEQPADFEGLRKYIERLGARHNTGGNRLFYLATNPEMFAPVAGNLGRAGLNVPGAGGALAALVVEKPFGSDLASARKLNRVVKEYFDEPRIFRIDHYLGKETVQNILVFRFANAIFEPLLNSRLVDHVQITTAETVGMEGRRGAYYETAGALRDMIQNHMLQLLALIAMDAPSCIRCEEVRDRKVEVLRSLGALGPELVAAQTVRGQYTAAGGMPAYRQELGVSGDSQVETYAAVKLFVDNARWAGVPFYLRTGKRLAAKASQIVIAFRREASGPFADPTCDVRGPNRLVIRIYPDEGISLVMDAKVPGVTGFRAGLLRPVKMDFSYGSTFESASPEAYEHLLLDAMNGDPMSFIRSDEVEASWAFIDSIKSSWDSSGLPKLTMYPSGSWGSKDADRLFGDPYKHWYAP